MSYPFAVDAAGVDEPEAIPADECIAGREVSVTQLRRCDRRHRVEEVKRHAAFLFGCRFRAGRQVVEGRGDEAGADPRDELHADKRCRDLDLVDLTDFMLATGLRIDEATAVTWDALDSTPGRSRSAAP